MVAGRLSIEDYKRLQSVSASNHWGLGNKTIATRGIVVKLIVKVLPWD